MIMALAHELEIERKAERLRSGKAPTAGHSPRGVARRRSLVRSLRASRLRQLLRLGAWRRAIARPGAL